jgi:uncharacterized membrane protein YphA (DoxX/SURF4 family)
MVCFFDRQSLPPDFDQQSANDPLAVIEGLQKEQRFWFGGDGDGGYLFHAYVNQPLPTDIANRAVVVERFQIPSGELWFCGVEYAANNPSEGSTNTPAGGLNAYPSQGSHITLPPGSYRAGVLRCEWSDSERASKVTEAIPVELRTRYRMGQAITVVAGAALVIGLIALFFSVLVAIALTCVTIYNALFQPEMLSRLPRVLAVWGPIALGGLTFSFLSKWVLDRSGNSRASKMATTAQRELPEYFVVLKLVDQP